MVKFGTGGWRAVIGDEFEKKDFYTATSPENAAVTALSRVSWCLGGV